MDEAALLIEEHTDRLAGVVRALVTPKAPDIGNGISRACSRQHINLRNSL